MLKKDARIRFKRIERFLLKSKFNGFTKDDLFIMGFIKKGWGQDIVALSNMAESLVNIHIENIKFRTECERLMETVLIRAIHPRVNPYKKDIHTVSDLGKYGYYLEHLNITIGAYRRIIHNDEYTELNHRVSQHLLKNSNQYNNYHLDL